MSMTRKFSLPRPDGDAPFKIYATVGLYEDGRPGEIFFTADRPGSLERGLLNALGIAISIGLQHGVSLSTFTKQLRGMRFEPAGFTGDPELPSCSSILDCVARWLEKKFGA